MPEQLESAVETMKLFEDAAHDDENDINSQASVIALMASCKALQREQREAVSAL